MKRCRDCEHWGIIDGGSEQEQILPVYGCLLEGDSRVYSDRTATSFRCEDDFVQSTTR